MCICGTAIVVFFHQSLTVLLVILNYQNGRVRVPELKNKNIYILWHFGLDSQYIAMGRCYRIQLSQDGVKHGVNWPTLQAHALWLALLCAFNLLLSVCWTPCLSSQGSIAAHLAVVLMCQSIKLFCRCLTTRNVNSGDVNRHRLLLLRNHNPDPVMLTRPAPSSQGQGKGQNRTNKAHNADITLMSVQVFRLH